MFMKEATRIYNQCLVDILDELRKNAYQDKPYVDSQYLIDKIDECKLKLAALLKADFETVLDDYIKEIENGNNSIQ